MKQMIAKVKELSRFGLYVWPLRVPVFSAVVLIALPWLAFTPSVSPLLSGLFDPLEERALVLITIVALFVAWTITLTGGLIIAYGAQRLDLPAVNWKFSCPIWIWPVTAGMTIPLIWRVIHYSCSVSGRSFGEMLAYTLLGAVVASVVLASVLLINAWFETQASELRKRAPNTWIERAYQRLLERLSTWPSLSSGFLNPSKAGRRPELARGHGLGLFLAVASVVIFLLSGWLTNDISRPDKAATLTYLLLLLLSLTWIVGMLAFLLDRTRMPLIAYMLVAAVGVNVFERVVSTDHIYRTVALDPDAPPRVSVSDLLTDANTGIVVAASGGGIQAAAWTARVLTGLRDAVPEFAAQLRLISAVSGGSVGAMNFLASMPECGPVASDGAAERFDANGASQESSLHAIGWGLVFKDLPRTLLPIFSDPAVDRGSVLEDAWKRERRLREKWPSKAAMLSSWRTGTRERRCPGVVYNSMAAETGEPFLFSTVLLPDSLRHFDFYGRYPQRDVQVTTAVRLSAGFPYVSPAARSDQDNDPNGYLHLVDGGYYDNYGVGTLVSMMHAALREVNITSPKRLLVLEVCDSAECSGAAPQSLSRGGTRRAWPYQVTAPLSALLAARSTAQRVNNRTSLRLLEAYWMQKGVCVQTVPVSFAGQAGPLSWHLTEAQKREIENTWTNDRKARTVSAVQTFLDGASASSAGGC